MLWGKVNTTTLLFKNSVGRESIITPLVMKTTCRNIPAVGFPTVALGEALTKMPVSVCFHSLYRTQRWTTTITPLTF